ncbi:chorismate mutase [Brachybacterium aquaticum]|uniref:Chorismate mutase n=1 Tax=Brachybacterium aquaticum TaxID=1432564 RepID=A0A841AGG0_9MICO|nr:chorismate mutase [Brachybacterium aquaticum]MBB5832128.1 chorismate mutase [Brachybacterium aquaticum]
MSAADACQAEARQDAGAPAGTDPVDPAREAEVARARELLGEERRSIDNIDAALVHLLAERFSHTQRVGVLKAEHGLPPADPSREQAQIERLRSLAHDAGLDPTFAEAFLRFIVTEVIRHHERIREEGPGES